MQTYNEEPSGAIEEEANPCAYFDLLKFASVVSNKQMREHGWIILIHTTKVVLVSLQISRSAIEQSHYILALIDSRMAKEEEYCPF
jgi:hypothetical protein